MLQNEYSIKKIPVGEKSVSVIHIHLAYMAYLSYSYKA